MPAYLHQVTTGDFYIHTDALAKRDDMQSVEAPTLDEAKAIVARRKAELELLSQPLVAEVPAEKPKASKAKKSDTTPEEPAVKTVFEED